MKDSVASMISNGALYTARRPDKAKHQPKVLNVVRVERREDHKTLISSCRQNHVVWRNGIQYEVTKQGLIPVKT